MRDTPSILFDYIQRQIANAIAQLPISYPCQVTAIDSKKKGFVEVQTLLPQTQNDLPRTIPVLRSPYLSLPIKVGDIGIALNCSFVFEKALSGEKIEKSLLATKKNGLFFIPLCESSKVKTPDNETTITSQNTNQKITLSDSEIIVSVDQKEVKFESDKVDFGVQIAQTQTPIDILGSGGNIYKAFDLMIQLMDLLASGMSGSATSASAYQGGKDALIATLKQIIKE